jgi:preprotein translocase subunit YajC
MDDMLGPLDLVTLFAQAQAAPAPQATTGNPLFNLLPLLPMLPIFYLVLVRPQQQAAKKLRATVDALKPRDKVITNMGLYGTVVSVDKAADKVVLRVDDDNKVRLTFSRGSIARVVEAAE